jgi:hypothetical protein
MIRDLEGRDSKTKFHKLARASNHDSIQHPVTVHGMKSCFKWYVLLGQGAAGTR